MSDLWRLPVETMPAKSRVALYRFPGGGLLWCVATARDLSLDLAGQTADALDVIDGYLAAHGLDRSRIVKAEIVVTDHGRKAEFDAVWSAWMPAGCGPVRSFVQSVMPEGDLVEIIVTAALPAEGGSSCIRAT